MRRTAETLAEQLQAAVDKHQLSTDTSLSRSTLVQIAARHGKVAQNPLIICSWLQSLPRPLLAVVLSCWQDWAGPARLQMGRLQSHWEPQVPTQHGCTV